MQRSPTGKSLTGSRSKNIAGGLGFSKEYLRVYAEAALVTVLFAQLFYGTFLAVIPIIPIGVYYAKRRSSDVRLKKKQEKKDEFRECLLCVRSGLRAGYAMENAWKKMEHLYGKDNEMVKRLKTMKGRLDINETMENVLDDFAEEMDIEEGKSFAEVYRFAKKSGGNFAKIIEGCIDRMSEKLEVEREIRTLTAAKRMEQMIMNLIPLGICLYLRLGSPGYLDVMYGNVMGIAIMTGALAVYVASYEISGRIIAIEV